MLEVIRFHAKRAYVVVVPQVDGDELIGPYTNIKRANKDALVWGGQVQVMLKTPGFLARCHESGLCALFCDDQANEHFGIPTKGVAFRFWRVRVYLSGFVQGLSI